MSESKKIEKKSPGRTTIRRPLAKKVNQRQEERAALYYKVPDTTIYVGNLSYERSEDQIRKMFVHFGKVKSVKIIKDKKTEKSKGIAFVQMESPASALKAVSFMNGKITDKRTLKVSIAQERVTTEDNKGLKARPKNNEAFKSSFIEIKKDLNGLRAPKAQVSTKENEDDRDNLTSVETKFLKTKKKKQIGGLEKLHQYLQNR